MNDGTMANEAVEVLSKGSHMFLPPNPNCQSEGIMGIPIGN